MACKNLLRFFVLVDLINGVLFRLTSNVILVQTNFQLQERYLSHFRKLKTNVGFVIRVFCPINRKPRVRIFEV